MASLEPATCWCLVVYQEGVWLPDCCPRRAQPTLQGILKSSAWSDAGLALGAPCCVGGGGAEATSLVPVRARHGTQQFLCTPAREVDIM